MERLPVRNKDNHDYIQGDDIKPCLVSRTVIQTFAEKVGNVCKFKPGNDIRDVVGKLGGTMDDPLYSFDPDIGSITVDGPQQFRILPEATASEQRNQFTIAHELGHYFLHSNQGEKKIIAYRIGSGRREWEANWFAAGLLMPEKAFRKEWEKTNSVNILSNLFNVSISAVMARKDNLQSDSA